MVADAVERCLLRIAEAATKLDDVATDLAPGPPWGEIRSLGNRLRHEYDGIDRATIWGIVRKDLTPLKAACKGALEKLGTKPPARR